MSSSHNAGRLADLRPEEAAALVDRGEAVLLDVREPEEWAAGHAPLAEHLPLAQVHPDAIPDGRTVITVCRSGGRSSRAADLLAGAGVPVHNLSGGMTAWAEAGLPVITDDGRGGAIT